MWSWNKINLSFIMTTTNYHQWSLKLQQMISVHDLAKKCNNIIHLSSHSANHSLPLAIFYLYIFVFVQILPFPLCFSARKHSPYIKPRGTATHLSNGCMAMVMTLWMDSKADLDRDFCSLHYYCYERKKGKTENARKWIFDM